VAGFLAALPYLVLFLALAADRLSKWWMADYLAENGVTVVNSFLTLRPTYNQGIAFGMFQGLGPAVGWLSIIIVGGMLIYLTRMPRQFWLLRTGLAMIIGGALGNQIDRLLTGEVLDFFEIPIRAGIFNVADVMINLGMVLCLASLVVHRSAMKEPADAAGAPSGELENGQPPSPAEEPADS
jgi:signal peptidase II